MNATTNPFGLMATPSPAAFLPAESPREHVEPARTWTYLRHGDRATVSVTCPSWCEADHKMSQYLTEAPEDVIHQVYGHEVTVKATDSSTYGDWRVLAAHLAVAPDAVCEPERRDPYVLVELVDEVWSSPMGPDELTAFIGTVAEQLDELRRLHARLVEVRTCPA